MKKSRATQEDVDRLLSLLYPDAVELAKVLFSEKKALNDASDLIESLQKQVEELQERPSACNVAAMYSEWDAIEGTLESKIKKLEDGTIFQGMAREVLRHKNKVKDLTAKLTASGKEVAELKTKVLVFADANSIINGENAKLQERVEKQNKRLFPHE